MILLDTVDTVICFFELPMEGNLKSAFQKISVH